MLDVEHSYPKKGQTYRHAVSLETLDDTIKRVRLGVDALDAVVINAVRILDDVMFL